MFNVIGKFWNEKSYKIISDGKDFYVLNENEWNGEKWYKCWRVLDLNGYEEAQDKATYTIEPVYKQNDEDDFDIVDYKVEKD